MSRHNITTCIEIEQAPNDYQKKVTHQHDTFFAKLVYLACYYDNFLQTYPNKDTHIDYFRSRHHCHDIETINFLFLFLYLFWQILLLLTIGTSRRIWGFNLSWIWCLVNETSPCVANASWNHTFLHHAARRT